MTTDPATAPSATPGETLDVDKLDVDEIERTWLVLCGSCDAGQPGYCTCPSGDHRAVIQRLAAEVRRLRSAVERARAERDFAQELRDRAAAVREHDRRRAERAILHWAADRIDPGGLSQLPPPTPVCVATAGQLRRWADELGATPAGTELAPATKAVEALELRWDATRGPDLDRLSDVLADVGVRLDWAFVYGPEGGRDEFVLRLNAAPAAAATPGVYQLPAEPPEHVTELWDVEGLLWDRAAASNRWVAADESKVWRSVRSWADLLARGPLSTTPPARTEGGRDAD